MSLAVDHANPVNWEHPLNAGLRHWWKTLADQQRGLYFRDLCARQAGTLTSLTPGTAWVGPRARTADGAAGGLQFTGGNANRVECGTFSVVSAQATFACWVLLRSVNASRDDRFISKADGTSSAQHDWMLGQQQSGSKDRFRCRMNRTDNTLYGNTAASSCVGVWCHVAATFHGDTFQGHLYLNGNQDTPYTDAFGSTPGDIFNGGALPNNSDAVYLANQPTATTNSPDAVLDDVRFWDRALSAAEILAYYRLTRQSYEPLLHLRPRRRAHVAVATDQVAVVPTATFTLSGVAPTVAKSAAVALASLALSGLAPTTAKAADAPPAALAFSGVVPLAPQSHAVSVASVAFSGVVPTARWFIGPISAGAAASVDDGGPAWSNPGNVLASDDARATVTITGPGETNSDLLRASDFDFSALPDSATIRGVKVEAEASADAAASVNQQVWLVIDGVHSGTSGSGPQLGTADTYHAHGHETQMWSEAITPADIKNAANGFDFRAIRTASGTFEARVDHMRMTVWYEPGQTVSVPVASFAISGVPATTAKSAAVSLATMALSGVVPTTTFTVPVSIASLALSGVVPTAAKSAAVDIAAVAYTGVPPATAKSSAVDVAVVTLAGVAPATAKAAAVSVATVTFGGVVPETVGSELPVAVLSFTGVAPATAKTAAVDLATIAHSGVAPATAKSATVEPGQLAFAGVEPTTAKRADVDAAGVTFSGVSPESAGAVDVPAAELTFAGAVPDVFFVAPVPTASVAFAGIVPGTVIAGLTGHLGGQVSVAAALGGVIGITPAIGGRVIVLPLLGGPVEVN